METVYRDYAPKGVQFFYLYKALAHPELHGYVTPVTLEERLMQIKEARRTLGTEIPWVCDTMSNELKHATGDAPNSEYLLDPEGKIVRKRGWSDPDALRKDLEKLVGPVENPTKVSDLNLKVEPPPKHAPTGIVPRVKLPERYLALRIEPQLQKSKEPFYVKPRVEADGNFLRSGKGKLYLGFHLDPLYGVHWNNLVAPVQYEFHPPEGVQISPSKGQGPKVEAEADADPREFLVDADRGNSKEPARIVFRYFACSEKWCKPVTQEYVVRWEVDPDGGAAARRAAGSEGQVRAAEELLKRRPDGQR
ncbi:MAG: hypothetical protein HY238_00575 [Acidobacteria bacterium]|nr:hypothetical protein [Acidobacteriota bacterium]